MAAAAVHDALEKEIKPQSMLNKQTIAVCWFQWIPGQEVRLDSQVLLDYMQVYLLIHMHKKSTRLEQSGNTQLHSCYCL